MANQPWQGSWGNNITVEMVTCRQGHYGRYCEDQFYLTMINEGQKILNASWWPFLTFEVLILEGIIVSKILFHKTWLEGPMK